MALRSMYPRSSCSGTARLARSAATTSGSAGEHGFGRRSSSGGTRSAPLSTRANGVRVRVRVTSVASVIGVSGWNGRACGGSTRADSGVRGAWPNGVRTRGVCAAFSSIFSSVRAGAGVAGNEPLLSASDSGSESESDSDSDSDSSPLNMLSTSAMAARVTSVGLAARGRLSGSHRPTAASRCVHASALVGMPLRSASTSSRHRSSVGGSARALSRTAPMSRRGYSAASGTAWRSGRDLRDNVGRAGARAAALGRSGGGAGGSSAQWRNGFLRRRSLSDCPLENTSFFCGERRGSSSSESQNTSSTRPGVRPGVRACIGRMLCRPSVLAFSWRRCSAEPRSAHCAGGAGAGAGSVSFSSEYTRSVRALLLRVLATPGFPPRARTTLAGALVSPLFTPSTLRPARAMASASAREYGWAEPDAPTTRCWNSAYRRLMRSSGVAPRAMPRRNVSSAWSSAPASSSTRASSSYRLARRVPTSFASRKLKTSRGQSTCWA